MFHLFSYVFKIQNSTIHSCSCCQCVSAYVYRNYNNYTTSYISNAIIGNLIVLLTNKEFKMSQNKKYSESITRKLKSHDLLITKCAKCIVNCAYERKTKKSQEQLVESPKNEGKFLFHIFKLQLSVFSTLKKISINFPTLKTVEQEESGRILLFDIQHPFRIRHTSLRIP